MAKRPAASTPAPLVEANRTSTSSFKVLLIGAVAIIAAVAMFVFRTAVDDTLLFVMLAILAMAGVFYLFASVIGFVHFGTRNAAAHPGADYINSLSDGVCITDESQSVVYANAAYGSVTGISDVAEVQTPEQLLSRHEDAANALYRLANNLARGESGEEELRLPKGLAPGDEGPRWYRLRARLMDARKEGGPLQVWALRDITVERDQQERVFLELQQAIDHLDRAPVGFFSADGAGGVQYINATLAGWLGVDLARFMPGTMDISEMLGEAAANVLSGMGGEQRKSRTAVVDTDIVRPDGERLPVQLIHSAYVDADGSLLMTRTILINRASAGDVTIGADSGDLRFNRFFNATPMAIAALDEQGRILRTNVAFASLFSPLLDADALARRVRFDTVLHDHDRERFGRAFDEARGNRGNIEPFDVVLPTKIKNDLTDNQAHVRIFVNPIARAVGIDADSDPDATAAQEVALVYVMDTTEQKGLENQMAQSQKMQAVGELAGGIAHDFNNVLTAIIMASDLLLSNHRPSDPSFPDIMNIKQNANRAASLVRQLLAFSRRQTLRPQVLSVTDVLADLRMLLSRLIGNSVDLKIEHSRELWPVKADLGQFEQVIVNLSVNARDAMPDGGTLTIRTANVEAAEAVGYNYRGLKGDQDYVLVDLIDTGTGMEPDVQKRIFEPFFTTKEVGKGTGLGLSMVYGIIKQTGGHIYVESEMGEGTTFRIFLPRHVAEATSDPVPVEAMPDAEGTEDAETAADEAAAPGAETEPAQVPAVEPAASKKRDLSGSATVLLVEDEDAVRMGGVRALTSRGYTVHEAASGLEAMEVMEEIGDEIDLIVSDVVMPEMDGPSLLREVRKMNPDIRFVFVSGYAEDAFSKNLPEGEKFGFLPKPFSLKQLATTVKEMLDGTEDASGGGS